MKSSNAVNELPPLLYDKRGQLAVITFNRPQALNALTPEMVCRMTDALLDAQSDPEVRVLVLTGAGGRAFCAGGDLGKMIPLLSGERPPQDAWDHRVLEDADVMPVSSLCDARLRKPIIAAIHGICVAAGAELLLGCDLRIVSSDARFAWPEVKRGLMPFAGSVWRLPRQVPHSQAMALLLTGETINAQQALAMGLVNEVVDSDEVLPRALALAELIAANAPLAVMEIKQAMAACEGVSQEEARKIEKNSYRRIMETEDAREGPRAFIEKRAPRYQGK